MSKKSENQDNEQDEYVKTTYYVEPMNQNPNINPIVVVEATAIESMERALIDTQVATAKKYPRPPLSKIRDNMMDFVTLDEETAASCFFTLPRGNKTIQGESIRMAEIAVSQYQNVRVSTRIISMVTAGEAPYVVVQGVAFDLEKNFASSIEKRRRIIGKKFKNGKIDEDDINLAVNACSAIAYRDATFKMIPKALIKPVFEAAKRVAIGDIRSLVAKRAEVIARLQKMGATQEKILAVLEARTVEDITVEQLQILIGLGTALKDGEVTLEDAFPELQIQKSGTNGLKERIKNGQRETGPPVPNNTLDPEIEKRKQKQLEKLRKAEAEKESERFEDSAPGGPEPPPEEIPARMPATPEPNTLPAPAKAYTCLRCDFEFDEPKIVNGKEFCPKCKSNAISEVK